MTTSLDASAHVAETLRARLVGRVATPGDERYGPARTIFYGGFDLHPAAVVEATNASEVATVVALAAEAGVELAVRSGGHSLAGHGLSDGGIVLDLSSLDSVEIDVSGRTAWAGSGLTAGDYTTAVGAYGLATGFGDTGSVGIGGLTLAGGIGFLVRKYGLTIDNLLAAEVVTADGAVLATDSDNHPDLFWAIRGGGGNFGVVTRFHFRLQEVPGIVGGALILPLSADVVTSFLELAEEAPDELSTIVNIMRAPPMPMISADYHGKPILFSLLAYAGARAEGERVVAPFRGLATPLADMVDAMPYADLFPPEEGNFHPVVATQNMFADDFDHATATEVIDRVSSSTADMAVTQIRVLGGAMSRIAPEATAFAHRRRKMMVNVAAATLSSPDIVPHRAWVDDVAGLIRQDEGAYVGFLGDEGVDRASSAYPPETWQRLRAIKASHDPRNVFRRNQNIPPA